MNDLMRKITSVLLFTIIFVNFTSVSSLVSQEDSIPNKILIISSTNDNEQFIVNQMLKTRLQLDPNLKYDFIDITKFDSILSLIGRSDINNSYSEFWIITDQFPYYDLASKLLNHLHYQKIHFHMIFPNHRHKHILCMDLQKKQALTNEIEVYLAEILDLEMLSK